MAPSSAAFKDWFVPGNFFELPPEGLFEDNRKKWSGDHVIDPQLVPGVLFMNRPFQTAAPTLLDLAPTILDALGLEKNPDLEGDSLL